MCVAIPFGPLCERCFPGFFIVVVIGVLGFSVVVVVRLPGFTCFPQLNLPVFLQWGGWQHAESTLVYRDDDNITYKNNTEGLSSNARAKFPYIFNANLPANRYFNINTATLLTHYHIFHTTQGAANKINRDCMPTHATIIHVRQQLTILFASQW